MNRIDDAIWMNSHNNTQIYLALDSNDSTYMCVVWIFENDTMLPIINAGDMNGILHNDINALIWENMRRTIQKYE